MLGDMTGVWQGVWNNMCSGAWQVWNNMLGGMAGAWQEV